MNFSSRSSNWPNAFVVTCCNVESTNRFSLIHYRSTKNVTFPHAANPTVTPAGDKSSKMIVVMITAFLLLGLPICIVNLYSPSQHFHRRLIRYTYVLTVTNTAIKFPMYLAYGKQFRRNFWRACPCLSRGYTVPQQPTLSM